jgi:Na+/proline symporter
MSHSAYLPYLVVILIIAMVVIRFMRSKRTGSAAVKFEVLYLMVYSFLGGVLATFFLEHQEIGWMSILILATFAVGFIVRTLPLFRLIKSVEEKAEGRF